MEKLIVTGARPEKGFAQCEGQTLFRLSGKIVDGKKILRKVDCGFTWAPNRESAIRRSKFRLS